MIKLKIDQIEFIIKEGLSILEACKVTGIEIPRFCYHDSLSIAGNCRMCLVKLEDDDKLLISCLTEIAADMEILTADPMIKKAREEILEFLLLNHPLDCPICDQAGECDLQDQSKKFGSNYSKFLHFKSSDDDTNFNVFIKAIMTRCIHCTRCARFSSEVAGYSYFGLLNRGGESEIGSYFKRPLISEISGNLIDLCPVGALTSKPYSFISRPWDLKSVESIDVTDSLGSNIYIHYIGSKIYRILPKFMSGINGNLITDKARFYYDSLDSKNVITYLSSRNFNKKDSAKKLTLAAIKEELLKKFSKEKILIVVPDNLNFETYSLLNKIQKQVRGVIVKSVALDGYLKSSNIFLNLKSSIKSLELCTNSYFLIGINPSIENSLINSKIKVLSNTNYFATYFMGYKFISNLNGVCLNIDLNEILLFFEGKSAKISNIFLNSEHGLLLLGLSALNRGIDIAELSILIRQLNPSILLLNLAKASNSIGLDLLNVSGITKNDVRKSSAVFFLLCRDNIFLKRLCFSNTNSKLKMHFWFNVYKLNVTSKFFYEIPIKSVFEESGVYLNLESRPQYFQSILESRIDAKSVYSFLMFIFKPENVAKRSFSFVSELLKMPEYFLLSDRQNYLSFSNKHRSRKSIISLYPMKPLINNFYKTDLYTDCSKNMSKASLEAQKISTNFF